MSWQIKNYVIFMYFKWWHKAQYLFFVIFDFEQEKLVTRYHGDDMVGPIQWDSFPHQWNLLLDLKNQTSTIKKGAIFTQNWSQNFLIVILRVNLFLKLACCGMAWSRERYFSGSDFIFFEIQSRCFRGASKKLIGFRFPHLWKS